MSVPHVGSGARQISADPAHDRSTVVDTCHMAMVMSLAKTV